MRLWPWSRSAPLERPAVVGGGALPMAGYRVTPPKHGFQVELGSAGSLEAPEPLLAELAGQVSGSPMSRKDALKVPAVLRARNLIADIPAMLEIRLHQRDWTIDDRTSIVTDPRPGTAPGFTYASTVEDLLFHQVSDWRVTRRGADGYPVAGHHVDHRSVGRHSMLGMPSEVLGEDLLFNPDDPIFVDGQRIPTDDIIMFLSPNPPLLTHAARAIRTLLLLDEATRMYASDPVPQGYFTDNPEADPLDDAEITEILNTWQAARRERVWGYVSQGLKLNEMSGRTPVELQLVELRNHQVLEIARATGLDAWSLGLDVSTSHSYTNPESRRLDQLQAAMPYLGAIEQRLSLNDVVPRGIVARFDASGFLRADMFTRAKTYEILHKTGVLDVAEIREREALPPTSETSASSRRLRSVG